MSEPTGKKPLTQEELEEMPGEALPERVAMSLLGGHALHPGGPPIAIDDVDPASEPLGGESVNPPPPEE
jgi:hypothetical protein